MKKTEISMADKTDPKENPFLKLHETSFNSMFTLVTIPFKNPNILWRYVIQIYLQISLTCDQNLICKFRGPVIKILLISSVNHSWISIEIMFLLNEV